MSQSDLPLPKLADHGAFIRRHIGPREADKREMLSVLGLASMDELVARVVPASILENGPLELDESCTEQEALRQLRGLADGNRVFRSYIGMGYYGTYTPPVIRSNATSWKTPPGTLPIHPISRRSLRADWKRYSISRQWFRI